MTEISDKIQIITDQSSYGPAPFWDGNNYAEHLKDSPARRVIELAMKINANRSLPVPLLPQSEHPILERLAQILQARK